MFERCHLVGLALSHADEIHALLRGGKAPNYDAANVEAAARELASAGLAPHLMIDFSHANASKRFEKQIEVGADHLTHIARAYRALARTYRVEAEKEPTNPYNHNMLKAEWLSAGKTREPEV